MLIAIKKRVQGSLVIALIACPVFASSAPTHEESDKSRSQAATHLSATQLPVTQLSEGTRALLQQEMQSLLPALEKTVSAYISGDWKAIKQLATQMKNSFILKQKLSMEQKHELHTKLPAQFIDKDKAFHYLAGMLAHVAEEKKVELVSFYLGELQKSCMGCHQAFAPHRFENFRLNSKDLAAHEHE